MASQRWGFTLRPTIVKLDVNYRLRNRHLGNYLFRQSYQRDCLQHQSDSLSLILANLFEGFLIRVMELWFRSANELKN
ncbi:hypothetical protein L1049_009387 [Liquidambar formosana]|uniref:Uncharacterized protein n=1 Tax=Liquidambar formosana TaxID=63359 RepID=A0AAP0SC52_LIQFO